MFNQWFRRRHKPEVNQIIPIEQLLSDVNTNLEIDDFEIFWTEYTTNLHSMITENIRNRKETFLITILGSTVQFRDSDKVVSFSIPFANVEPEIAKHMIVTFGEILKEEQYG